MVNHSVIDGGLHCLINFEMLEMQETDAAEKAPSFENARFVTFSKVIKFLWNCCKCLKRLELDCADAEGYFILGRQGIHLTQNFVEFGLPWTSTCYFKYQFVNTPYSIFLSYNNININISIINQYIYIYISFHFPASYVSELMSKAKQRKVIKIIEKNRLEYY